MSTDDLNDADDMRADFDAAIEAVESDTPPEEPTQDTPPEEDIGAPIEETATQAEDETQAQAPDPEGEEPPGTPSDSGAGKSKDEKAPAGWTPAEREQWAGLPPAVKARVTKREQEINDFMNKGAENRKLGQSYKEMTDQYTPVFAAEGIDNPVAGIKALLNTAATLQSGSPQQKAQTIAKFIQNYGVDINTLDSMLAGEEPGDPQTNQIEQLLDQRLAPVNQLMDRLNSMQQQTTQQTEEKAAEDVDTFSASAEFISDVRLDMADLMDMAAKRGQKMTLQEAYDKACALNPEITDVMAKREQDAKITGQNQDVAAKLNAASSITGQPGGTGAPAGDMSLRETLEQQWGQTG